VKFTRDRRGRTFTQLTGEGPGNGKNRNEESEIRLIRHPSMEPTSNIWQTCEGENNISD
jgi:hypothetical protein